MNNINLGPICQAVWDCLCTPNEQEQQATPVRYTATNTEENAPATALTSRDVSVPGNKVKLTSKVAKTLTKELKEIESYDKKEHLGKLAALGGKLEELNGKINERKKGSDIHLMNDLEKDLKKFMEKKVGTFLSDTIESILKDACKGKDRLGSVNQTESWGKLKEELPDLLYLLKRCKSYDI